jgi:hypothetical protein
VAGLCTTGPSGDFTFQGTYEFNTTTKRLTLRPDQGTSLTKVYDLDKSYLKFATGEWFTKNPETGGGVNGSKTGTFAGIWKDVGKYDNEADRDVPMGFNGDDEYFEPLPQQNKDGKTWWFVVGSYKYDSAHDELIIDDGKDPRTYRVTLTIQGKQVELEYTSGANKGKKTTFQKQDF